MTSNISGSLLTIEEASSFLNLKVSRLRTAIFKREIPFIKIGRLIRFDQKDLTEWIENQKKKFTRDNPWDVLIDE